MTINISIDTDDQELKASIANLIKFKLQGTGLDVKFTEELNLLSLNRTSYMSTLNIQSKIKSGNGNVIIS